LGVHPQTLYKYEKAGIIETIRTPGGKRLYNVKDYLNKIDKEINIVENTREKICYCRVSTNGQKKDLNNQIEYMKNLYPSYKIVYDIGSGINFKRKGLQKIIQLAHEEKIEEVVIAYKDRLCRIGYDLIKFIIEEFSHGKITIINDIKHSPEEEITTDLLQIIIVFSARLNGLRNYKQIMKNDNSLLKITDFQ
jgi:putative resolvase